MSPKVDSRRCDAGRRCAFNQAAICGTSSWPDAALSIRPSASSTVYIKSCPLRRQKTRVADHASRLLPSTSAWLRTSEWRSAAALTVNVGYASSPKTVT